MLAPGEYLLKPPAETPLVEPAAECTAELLRPAVPTVPAVPVVPVLPPGPAQEREPRSFLLILLRALGAVHT